MPHISAARAVYSNNSSKYSLHRKLQSPSSAWQQQTNFLMILPIVAKHQVRSGAGGERGNYCYSKTINMTNKLTQLLLKCQCLDLGLTIF